MSFVIYLITVVGSLKIAAQVISGIIGAGLIIGIIIRCVFTFDDWMDRDGEKAKKLDILLKKSIWIFIITLLPAIFVPTTEQAAAIYLVPKIVENEQVQNISDNSLKILQQLTENYLKDLAIDETKK